MSKKSRGSDLDMRMMMLGAALVGTNPAAAKIVAEAMAEIERLRNQKKGGKKR